MAFTGLLGTSDSQLGNLELGTSGSPAGPSFTLDAVLKRNQSASLTLDAITRVGRTGSFTLDATLTAFVQTLTLNAVIRKGQTASLSLDADLKRTQTASLTLDSTLVETVSPWFFLDAVITAGGEVLHNRTGPHTGVDHSVDHTAAHTFDRYLRGDLLHDILVDFDARLTAMETSGRHKVSRLQRLSLGGVVKKFGQTSSFTIDSRVVIYHATSLTLDAVIVKRLRLFAVIRATNNASVTLNAVIV